MKLTPAETGVAKKSVQRFRYAIVIDPLKQVSEYGEATLVDHTNPQQWGG